MHTVMLSCLIELQENQTEMPKKVLDGMVQELDKQNMMPAGMNVQRLVDDVTAWNEKLKNDMVQEI